RIGAAGQASIDAVAGPVGEALIMTALGLVVAVPAVMAYNWLMRRNKAIIEELAKFSNDLHGYMMSGGQVRPVVATAAAGRGGTAGTSVGGGTAAATGSSTTGSAGGAPAGGTSPTRPPVSGAGGASNVSPGGTTSSGSAGGTTSSGPKKV
ncbi:MAG: biopolymer transport protein ExbB, partial [Sphingomonadales bacterium]|nr:biopolymer transport protein ExbB [Sphingomonadales bacterium]